MKNFFVTFVCSVAVLLLIGSTLSAQVAINKDGSSSTDTTAMLEIKKGIKSKLKIRSLNYNDTVVLEMSNRNTLNEGTDFIISSNRESGLRISTQSDLTGNTHNGIMHLTPQGMVGINNTVPLERLDINGNINVSGSIKLNGNTGMAGQVLVSNGNAPPQWSNAAFGDSTRFSVYFNSSATAGDVAYSTIYNRNPSVITVSGNVIIITKSGFYHLEGSVNSTMGYTSAPPRIPTHSLSVYFNVSSNPGFYKVVHRKTMTPLYSNFYYYGNSEQFSIDVYLIAPISIYLFSDLEGPGGTSFIDTDGFLNGHLISE